jgi:AcrR family transcriptional regulator
MLNRQEIRAALPYGSLSEIATRAGVRVMTVTNWFRSNSNNLKVQQAAIEVLAEQIAANKAVEQQLEAAFRGEKI